ncbi:MAG: C39 family peptidase [Anaerolineales bacterium]|nr:C39 family peptidase [Anaerolineales bacterium]
MQCRVHVWGKYRVLIFASLLIVLFLSTPDPAKSDNPETIYYRATETTLPDGDTIEETIINGPPTAPDYPRPLVTLADPMEEDGVTIITSVPAFNWSFGCSATSAAMIAGYYDRNGYPNMYAGPTHGGIMPMDNSYWTDWTDECYDTRHQCPLSAAHYGLDGRSSYGHVDDYWVCYGSDSDDPFDGFWTEHTDKDCTGDYMYTNQTTNYGISDGATRFWGYANGDKLYCDTLESWGGQYEIDGTLGFRNFFESRGYTVSECYYQKTDNQYAGGFSFADYQAEIDAGHPVMLHVEGHTMVGFGYDDTAGDVVYLHDTWDYNAHSMTWGGSYSSMEMVAVSILHLDPTGVNSAQTGNWDKGATWDSGTVPGSSDNVTIQSGYTVTLDSKRSCQNLTIEFSGTLIINDGASMSVEGTLVNNGKIQQTLKVPAGSTTEFLHITNAAGTTVKYYGLDITPDSKTMGSTTVSIQGNHTGGCTSVSNDALLYRCFEITPAYQQSAALKFWFDEDERNGQYANALVLWHNDGSSSWTKVGTYAYSESTTDCQSGDGTACWMEASGISSYSVFDIGNNGNAPTAVELLSFSLGGTKSIVPGFSLLATALVSTWAAVRRRK